MAAPAFRSDTETIVGDDTSITGSEPASAAQNDAFIAVLGGVNDGVGFGTITIPSGWTEEVRTSTGVEGEIEQITYSIRRGASAPSFAWSWTINSDANLTITAYSGADTTTLTEVPAGQVNSSSTSVTAPSITTTVADTTLHFAGLTLTATTFTPPSGMTERADFQGDGTIDDITLEIADVAQAASGASGDKVATAGGAAVNIGQLIAIRPVAAAGNPKGPFGMPFHGAFGGPI